MSSCDELTCMNKCTVEYMESQERSKSKLNKLQTQNDGFKVTHFLELESESLCCSEYGQTSGCRLQTLSLTALLENVWEEREGVKVTEKLILWYDNMQRLGGREESEGWPTRPLDALGPEAAT